MTTELILYDYEDHVPPVALFTTRMNLNLAIAKALPTSELKQEWDKSCEL